MFDLILQEDSPAFKKQKTACYSHLLSVFYYLCLPTHLEFELGAPRDFRRDVLVLLQCMISRSTLGYSD